MKHLAALAAAAALVVPTAALAAVPNPWEMGKTPVGRQHHRA